MDLKRDTMKAVQMDKNHETAWPVHEKKVEVKK
jgi:hypothetical protein